MQGGRKEEREGCRDRDREGEGENTIHVCFNGFPSELLHRFGCIFEASSGAICLHAGVREREKRILALILMSSTTPRMLAQGHNKIIHFNV